MKAVIASAASAASLIHAMLLAVPAILLVRLWSDAGFGPPIGERIVIVQSTALLVAADIALAAITFRAAFLKIRANVSALGIAYCVYAVLTGAFFGFSKDLSESEMLGHWVDSIWKFLGAGVVLCILATIAATSIHKEEGPS
jgi:hypothetical protein